MSAFPATDVLGRVERILAIRLARLGDVTLLLPSLVRLKASFPGARLTLATGLPCAPLGEMCPGVDEVLAIDRLAMRDGSKIRAFRDIVGLVRGLRSRRFDLAVDFHSFRETNLLAGLSGARHRLGMKRTGRPYLGFCFNLPPVLEDKGLHVVRMFQRVAEGVPGVRALPPGDSMVLSPPRELAPARPVGRSVVALYVGASVASRRWPAARFGAVAGHVAAAWGASVWVLAGASKEEEAIAREVVAATPDVSGGRVRIMAGLPLFHLAAAIGASDLLVSNDTGPMHLGSALGVPTLGIFSESLPLHYSPIGPGGRYIKKEAVEAVSVSEVVGLMEEMRATANPGRPL